MDEKVRNICVSVPEKFHRKAKIYAVSQGMTLKALVVKLVEREAGNVRQERLAEEHNS